MSLTEEYLDKELISFNLFLEEKGMSAIPDTYTGKNFIYKGKGLTMEEVTEMFTFWKLKRENNGNK